MPRRGRSRDVENLIDRREWASLAYQGWLQDNPRYSAGDPASYDAFQRVLEQRRQERLSIREQQAVARNLRALRRNRQARNVSVLSGGRVITPAPNPRNLTASALALQWLNDNLENIINGQIYIMQIGDVYYTVNTTTYRRLFNLAMNRDVSAEEDAMESDPKVV